jgi:hypothetical protein
MTWHAPWHVPVMKFGFFILANVTPLQSLHNCVVIKRVADEADETKIPYECTFTDVSSNNFHPMVRMSVLQGVADTAPTFTPIPIRRRVRALN